MLRIVSDNTQHSDDTRLQKPHPNALLNRAACTGPTASQPSKYWLDEQDHTGDARGIAPFIENNDRYPVFRNVLDFKVANDGTGDQSDALQDAVNSDGNGGSRYKNGLTTRPAEVYLPGGTYQISKVWDLRVGTIIVGDPNDPPVIKASADFVGDAVVNGYDFGTGAPETSFMTLLKNIVIDTTAIDKSKAVMALNWGVAQGAGMSNIKIIMPEDSTGHTGIVLKGGSTIAVTDVVSLELTFPVQLTILIDIRISTAARLVSRTQTSKSTSRTSTSTAPLLPTAAPVDGLPFFKASLSTLADAASILPLKATRDR